MLWSWPVCTSLHSFLSLIFGCTGSSLLHRLSPVAVCGILIAAASLIAEHGLQSLQCGLSSCGARA